MLKKIIFYLKLRFKQKKFKKNRHIIKYIFEKSESNSLIVVFSGFPGKNQTARYNYIKTLEKYKVNKLFILDDIGPNKRGAYYLGKNKNFYFAELVEELINDIKSKTLINRTLCVGSSKGGYAALYFGLKINADVVISGAPQYYIGDYLYNEDHKPIYEYITGDKSDESVDFLNNILYKSIKDSTHKPIIHLHYSINEHTYTDHIKYLIRDLKKYGYKLYEDKKEYYKHSEVANFFPRYLTDTILKYIYNDY
jgi:hypothetical protein